MKEMIVTYPFHYGGLWGWFVTSVFFWLMKGLYKRNNFSMRESLRMMGLFFNWGQMIQTGAKLSSVAQGLGFFLRLPSLSHLLISAWTTFSTAADFRFLPEVSECLFALCPKCWPFNLIFILVTQMKSKGHFQIFISDEHPHSIGSIYCLHVWGHDKM